MTIGFLRGIRSVKLAVNTWGSDQEPWPIMAIRPINSALFVSLLM